MYQERMMGYYPQAIQMIAEFQAIVDAEAPEFEQVSVANEHIVSDAYLSTMGEDRLSEWEKVLSIKPLPNSTVSDRRDTIIARIRGQGKLNTATINGIVNAFTGGTAESWIEDSCLYVSITPPRNNKTFKFENVEREIKLKIPAHLNFNVSRSYNVWHDVKVDNGFGWKQVRACHDNWWDVLYKNTRKPNELDVTTFEKFYLG